MVHPKIGVALSSGAVRCFCQIGVLAALEEAQIPIHAISGSSAGAMIAAAYAIGRPIQEMETLAKNIPWSYMFDLKPSATALLAGSHWKKFIEIFTQGKQFHQTHIPLSIATTNLSKQRVEIHSSGNLQKVVLASSSIPGIVPPVMIRGDEHVDGAVTDPVPFTVLQHQKCDIIIAVDLSGPMSQIQMGSEMMKKSSMAQRAHQTIVHDEMHSLFELIENNRFFPSKITSIFNNITLQIIEWCLLPARLIRRAAGRRSLRIPAIMQNAFDITQRELLKQKKDSAPNVIFIEPNFSHTRRQHFWDVQKYIRQGYLATQKQIPIIRKRIRQAKKRTKSRRE